MLWASEKLTYLSTRFLSTGRSLLEWRPEYGLKLLTPSILDIQHFAVDGHICALQVKCIEHFRGPWRHNKKKFDLVCAAGCEGNPSSSSLLICFWNYAIAWMYALLMRHHKARQSDKCNIDFLCHTQFRLSGRLSYQMLSEIPPLWMNGWYNTAHAVQIRTRFVLKRIQYFRVSKPWILSAAELGDLFQTVRYDTPGRNWNLNLWGILMPVSRTLHAIIGPNLGHWATKTSAQSFDETIDCWDNLALHGKRVCRV